jgi:hypothetical protein
MTLLVSAMVWPNIPAITAMALVALGATDITLVRYRGTTALAPILLLHAVTYGGLYALFIGAALAAVASQPTGGLGAALILDLAASTVPAAATLRHIYTGIGSHLISER